MNRLSRKHFYSLINGSLHTFEPQELPRNNFLITNAWTYVSLLKLCPNPTSISGNPGT
jgi:hypothetical protein